MPEPALLPPDRFEPARFVRAGDVVVVGQGAAEPRTLTERLVRDRHAIGPFRVFLGGLFSDTFTSAPVDGIGFGGYGGIGRGAKLSAAGLLDPTPCHYSETGAIFASGRQRADVVLLQVSPPLPGRRPSLGLCLDYVLEAACNARAVIAEVNNRVPWTRGAELPADLRVDAWVAADRPPIELPSAPPGPVERRIAEHIAGLVEDGATIQTGIGSLPGAILSLLRDRRDLGVHSGMIGDGILDLIEAGAVTNARKAIDTGVTVTGVLLGTRRLYDYAHDNPALRMEPGDYTHSSAVLAQLDRLIAINSAVEVDLTGQVNGELVDGVYAGAVGGQVDFVRAANKSRGGASVIALPATARKGTVSRIVPRIKGGVVTTPRSDAGLIVTEHGIADLRFRPLAERVRRMIEIAAPAFREGLAEAGDALLKAGRP